MTSPATGKNVAKATDRQLDIGPSRANQRKEAATRELILIVGIAIVRRFLLDIRALSRLTR